MVSTPTRSLRAYADLYQLGRQAKELLSAFRAGDARSRIECSTRLSTFIGPLLSPSHA
jgi:hypothetical protein